jgi:hypothetical protein
MEEKMREKNVKIPLPDLYNHPATTKPSSLAPDTIPEQLFDKHVNNTEYLSLGTAARKWKNFFRLALGGIASSAEERRRI